MAKLTSNEIEAANRAEATSLLIRAGFRVYRPEADVLGEDLVLRSPDGVLRAVQLKSRPTVDQARYGGRQIWMLFPDLAGDIPGRRWFLIEHDVLFKWIFNRHGASPGWSNAWSYNHLSVHFREFLQPYIISCVAPVLEIAKHLPSDPHCNSLEASGPDASLEVGHADPL